MEFKPSSRCDEEVQKITVAGAGLVGSYFSVRFLQEYTSLQEQLGPARLPKVKLFLYDNTPFWRKVCIRVGFAQMLALPEGLRRKVFPGNYAAAFEQPADAKTFFQGRFPGMRHHLMVQLKDFSEKVTQFCAETYGKDMFEYSLVDRVKADDASRHFYPELSTSQGLIVTSGGQGHHLQEHKLIQHDHDFNGHYERAGLGLLEMAFLVQFERSVPEAFDTPFWDAIGSMSAAGMYYAHTNNEKNAVQVYCFHHLGKFVEPYYKNFSAELKGWCRKTLIMKSPLSTRGDDASEKLTFLMHDNEEELLAAALDAEAAAMWTAYKRDVIQTLIELKIGTPEELKTARIFCAPRGEHFHDTVFGEVKRRWKTEEPTKAEWNKAGDENDDPSSNIPTFFMGDAAGSTDYACGLSGARGLFMADCLVKTVMKMLEDEAKTQAAAAAEAAAANVPKADTQSPKRRQSLTLQRTSLHPRLDKMLHVAFCQAGAPFQKMWDHVVLTAFRQRNPGLQVRPDMLYRYMAHGRKLVTDGKEILEGAAVLKAFETAKCCNLEENFGSSEGFVSQFLEDEDEDEL
mmetsp:Transcript_99264/g.173367  ORF Transcript_99264/g.173367 Transcript_99264/m.173367 type:complete len:571 (+) Transcript_99264:84-1796(+)